MGVVTGEGGGGTGETGGEGDGDGKGEGVGKGDGEGEGVGAVGRGAGDSIATGAFRDDSPVGGVSGKRWEGGRRGLRGGVGNSVWAREGGWSDDPPTLCLP